MCIESCIFRLKDKIIYVKQLNRFCIVITEDGFNPVLQCAELNAFLTIVNEQGISIKSKDLVQRCLEHS